MYLFLNGEPTLKKWSAVISGFCSSRREICNSLYVRYFVATLKRMLYCVTFEI